MSRSQGIGQLDCRSQQPKTDLIRDADLLDRFLTDRDELAFRTLLMRHGAKVQRVCRRWLGDGQDADDAFQVTFIILVNRAAEIQQTDDISRWLLGVARRVALRTKAQVGGRNRIREQSPTDLQQLPDKQVWNNDDLSPILRAEVDRLPDKYRRPIELCYWEGLNNEQAAQRLRCPTGTLKWRLSRARQILRGRLERLGAVLAVLLFWKPAETRANHVKQGTTDRLGPDCQDQRLHGDPVVADPLIDPMVPMPALAEKNSIAIEVLRQFHRLGRKRRWSGWIRVLVAVGLVYFLVVPSIRAYYLSSRNSSISNGVLPGSACVH